MALVICVCFNVKLVCLEFVTIWSYIDKVWS